MCTAATYHTKDHYFGRNLDLEYSYRESVTITPRNFILPFRHRAPMEQHYAFIGMATVADSYPLYYDGTNEHGLSIAALNFPVSAKYYSPEEGKHNIASFELIPWILGCCKTVEEAKQMLEVANITNTSFSLEYPYSPLHWIISDAKTSITVESTDKGMQIYDNPLGILTNEPAFSYHMKNLQNYLHISNEEPTNHLAPDLPLKAYSRGMGGIGLPGDLSSASRFIKAAFTKNNSVSKDSESASISQLFHILGSVAQQQGCVKVGNLYEKTIYTSCCNAKKGIYYYTTYENSQITGVRLFGVDLNAMTLFTYPLVKGQQIRMEN